MFGGRGANLESCLAGLEESFWLFSNSCRHADTINTKRNRSRKAHIPQVENVMVSEILKEAGVYDLLNQQRITRMPTIPTANYDDHPETVEISSDEEEEVPDDDPSSPPARGSRKEQTSGESETEAGEDEVEVEDEEEDMRGQPSEAKKRRTEVRSIREQFDKMIREASQVKFCFQCGGEHNLEQCPRQGDVLMSPKWQQQPGEGRTSFRREESCLRGNDGIGQDSPRKKK